MDSIVEAEGAASSPSPPQKSLKQACDNCRRRKIKCNRAQPCDKCQRLLLSCSYCDVLQRKGPKFRTLYPLAPLHTLASQYPTPPQSIADQASQTEFVNPEGWNPQIPWNININQSYESYSSPDSADSQYEISNPNGFQASMIAQSHTQPPTRSQSLSLPSQSLTLTQSQSRRLSPTTLLAHVNVYLKYLYPIIPVISPEQVINDSQEPERISTERYAFLAALCAATHVQLQLDEFVDSSSSSSHISSLALSGIELLTEATNARSDCNNICEHVTIESLLTSFFLFAAYGNLDRQDQAWFYLSQATSMALTLGLHREATYFEFEETEAEERRRVFWLLFVTERAYALQQAKPIMLRNSIRKPKIISTEDPMIQYGFHNLINIFEKLTADLYDWIAIECDENLVASMRRPSGHTNLRDIQQRNYQFSAPVPIDSVMQIQSLDVALTQQWLQVMIWKLSMSDLSQPKGADALLPFHLPVLVGKAVMDVFQGSTVLQSVDYQERRLFNMNPDQMHDNPPADQLARQNLASTDPNINNEEFLLDILNILTRIRRNYYTHQPHRLLSPPSPSSTSSSNRLFQQ